MTTVLVVDDVASQRQLTAGLIRRTPDWKVIFAGNGKEALEALAKEPADVILTDMLMPEMDGLQLLRAARVEHPDIPVVLMTASGSEEVAVRALKEGAASYVPKKALPTKLTDTLRSVLSAARAHRADAELEKRMVSQEYHFEFENDPALVLTFPDHVKAPLRHAGFEDHVVRIRIHVALEEALANSLYHGNLEIGNELRGKSTDEFFRLVAERAEQSPYRERRLHVRALYTNDHAEFRIRDEGKGFDTSSLPQATDPDQLDKASGRGIVLMRTFMDEVRYNAAGNEVTMVKRKKGGA